MFNYPDDIRDYDNDPRSPYYRGRYKCAECGEEVLFVNDEGICEDCEAENNG